MISPFGVDHGEISKSLKPPHKAALMRTALDDDLSNWKNSMYAHDRLALHGIKDINAKTGNYKGPLDLSANYHKKNMGRYTRSTRQKRDKNRKAIFGDGVTT